MNKFICSSSALLRQLKQVSFAIRRNPVIPVLENVLFSVVGTELRLTASDLENTISVSLPIESSGQTWGVCAPLKPLLDVLSNLPDQPITVALGVKENQLTINATASDNGETYGGASYTFGGELMADYPKTAVVHEQVRLIMPGHLLRTALTYTSPLVASDELRPAMMCVHVRAGADKAIFEATDGHRLVQYEALASKEPGYSFEGKGKKLLIPGKALAILNKLVKPDDMVTITARNDTGGSACFQIGTYGPTVTVRMVDERFPDTDNVIPVEFNGGTLTLSRPAAKSMLARLRPFVCGGLKRIHLHFNGTGGYAEGKDEGLGLEAREALPGTFAAGSIPLKETAFNIDFLAHLIGLMPGLRVRMQFSGPDRAMVLTADGHEGLRFLLMPVRIAQYV
jgi:DNA polymerase-3 subunit beta